MTEVTTTQAYVVSDGRSVAGIAVTGFVVGLVGWLMSLAIQNWIIEPIFCRSTQTFGVCAEGGTAAWAIAMIIVSVVGLLSLVRNATFRPLLVVLAALISLWSVSVWLGPMAWWLAMLWHGLLFAAAYSLFAWVARLRSFLLSLVIIIILIVLLRLVVLHS